MYTWLIIDVFCSSMMQSGENEEGDEESEEGEAAGDPAAITGSLGAQYGGANELFYSQFELHTRQQKNNQIVLLQVNSCLPLHLSLPSLQRFVRTFTYFSLPISHFFPPMSLLYRYFSYYVFGANCTWEGKSEMNHCDPWDSPIFCSILKLLFLALYFYRSF